MPPAASTRRDNQHDQARDARLRLIMDNARALLLQNGYAGASLNEIMRLSGGSKATIAKHFGNKAGLFRAVFHHFSSRFMAENAFVALSGDWREVLRQMARILLVLYLRPEGLLVYRSVVGEGPREPEMAAAFYLGAHRTVVAEVAACLQRWQAEGLVVTSDPDADADRFTHLIRAGLYEQVLLGLRGPPSESEIAQAAKSAAALFARGVAAAMSGP